MPLPFISLLSELALSHCFTWFNSCFTVSTNPDLATVCGEARILAVPLLKNPAGQDKSQRGNLR